MGDPKWQRFLEGSRVFTFGRRVRDWISSGVRRGVYGTIHSPWVVEWVDLFRTRPLSSFGTILTVALLTHGILLWILGRRIGIVGMVFRGVLLLLSLVGLSHTSDWNTVKRHSFVAKLLFPGKEG